MLNQAIKTYLAFTFLIVSLSVSGQDRDLIQEMADNYLQVRQKPNTNHLLREYLSSVSTSEDTLYALIYEPMFCPRCEAVIQPFYRMLKSAHNNMLLITVYKDSTAAAAYNRTQNYTSDYMLYDTQNSYSPIFSFNFAELHGLFLLKLCKSEGRMIAGGDPTQWSDRFVSQLTAFTESWDYHLYAGQESANEKLTGRTPSATFIKERFTDLPLELPSDVFISDVNETSVFADNHFFYNDKLNNAVMYFSGNGKTGKLQFQESIRVDSTEKNRFVELPDKMLHQHIKNGMIFYMANGINFIDDGHIGISYSLPQITMETDPETGNNNVSYMNAAVIISRNLLSLQTPDSIIELKDIGLSEDYFYKHFTFSVVGDYILISCKKLTWPIESEPEYYVNNPSMNPFCDVFYQSNNPFMAAINRHTGKPVTRFGNLEECHHRSYTGYYFTSPCFTTHGNEVLYTDSYSGQLYIAESDNLNRNKEHHSLFEVETSQFPPVDTSGFHTYEYVKTYHRFFDRCIESVKLTKDNIFCIVRYNSKLETRDVQKDEFTFACISRKNGKVKEYRLPHYAGCEVLEYGLRTSENQKVNPYIFMKKEGKAFLRVFK